jgi:hypothetical protein
VAYEIYGEREHTTRNDFYRAKPSLHSERCNKKSRKRQWEDTSRFDSIDELACCFRRVRPRLHLLRATLLARRGRADPTCSARPLVGQLTRSRRTCSPMQGRAAASCYARAGRPRGRRPRRHVRCTRLCSRLLSRAAASVVTARDGRVPDDAAHTSALVRCGGSQLPARRPAAMLTALPRALRWLAGTATSPAVERAPFTSSPALAREGSRQPRARTRRHQLPARRSAAVLS